MVMGGDGGGGDLAVVRLDIFIRCIRRSKAIYAPWRVGHWLRQGEHIDVHAVAVAAPVVVYDVTARCRSRGEAESGDVGTLRPVYPITKCVERMDPRVRGVDVRDAIVVSRTPC